MIKPVSNSPTFTVLSEQKIFPQTSFKRSLFTYKEADLAAHSLTTIENPPALTDDESKLKYFSWVVNTQKKLAEAEKAINKTQNSLFKRLFNRLFRGVTKTDLIAKDLFLFKKAFQNHLPSQEKPQLNLLDLDVNDPQFIENSFDHLFGSKVEEIHQKIHQNNHDEKDPVQLSQDLNLLKHLLNDLNNISRPSLALVNLRKQVANAYHYLSYREERSPIDNQLNKWIHYFDMESMNQYVDPKIIQDMRHIAITYKNESTLIEEKHKKNLSIPLIIKDINHHNTLLEKLEKKIEEQEKKIDKNRESLYKMSFSQPAGELLSSPISYQVPVFRPFNSISTNEMIDYLKNHEHIKTIQVSDCPHVDFKNPDLVSLLKKIESIVYAGQIIKLETFLTLKNSRNP
ncbi:MAG: hypothetical protein ACOVOR_04975 [Rhabdochlamydiaceae bacterium]